MSGFIIPDIIKIEENDGKAINNLFSGDEDKKLLALSWKKSQSGNSPYVIFDFRRKTTGFIFTEIISATKGARLKIEYGPLLNLLPQNKILNPSEMINEWVDNDYIACRYIKLSLDIDENTFESGEIEVEISKFALIFSAYPAISKGSFKSQDSKLDKIWEMGAYTVQLCMQKNTQSSIYNPHLPEKNKGFIAKWKSKYSPYVIFDGPRRDRETWIGDIRTEALAVYSAFGASEVCKSSIEIFKDLQRNSGLTVGCGSTWQEFKEYNLWWVVSVWECFLFTGDYDFLSEMYPPIKKFMDWLVYHLDERKFIYNDNNWMWTLPREGFSSATQCILYHTLICAAEIEKHMGNSNDETEYRDISVILKKQINDTFWDEDRGIYTDELKLINTRIPVMSDVNCYAITFGIADSEKHEKILKYLRENMWTGYGSATLDYRMESAELDPEIKAYPLAQFINAKEDPKTAIIEYMYPHNRMIWPFVNGYEVQARFVAGDVDGAFELINDCWGNMVDKEPGTFWECVDADTGEFPLRTFFPGSTTDSYNSAAHGWSGWISYIMQSHILGITPDEPGFIKTNIRPQTGNLNDVEGEMPTPYGSISVKISKDNTKYNVQVYYPKKIKCIVEVTDNERKNLEVNITCIAK